MSSRWQLLLFFSAVAVMSAAMGVHESIFNNFLSDTFHLGADVRGRLEFPRELPGLLVVLTAGILSMIALTRVAAIGALGFAAGMVGIALLGRTYGVMVVMMMLGSAGMHLLQPVRASLALALSNESNRGTRMGQMSAVGSAGVVLGAGLVWLGFDKTAPPYAAGFLCVAACAAVGAVIYLAMNVPELRRPRARLVVRKRYRLYYLLEFLFGARKQIFITFGPWVLIQVYGEPASGIAGLLMTASIIGIAFKPIAGWAIDRFGERAVMIADGLVLAVVCVGYGYAINLTGDPDTARPVACACFVADNLLFALGASRTVYLSRLSASPQEINSTLAMGVSINHIASMTIPAVAGAIWIGLGYERVFAGAAVLALGIAVVSTWVPKRNSV